MKTAACILAWASMGGLAGAADGEGPPRLPSDAPKLTADKVVMVVGSSVSVRKYGVHGLPEWTGGPNRVPPQCTNGQNVFFRVFEMLNDHENMCWRRLPDDDWKKTGQWTSTTRLPWSDASPRISWIAADADAAAEITIPAGYEKADLIYTSDPQGDRIRVTIDGRPPPANAQVDTFQDTAPQAKADLGPVFDTLDSHGKPIKIGGRVRPIRNIVELRARYTLDPSGPHTFGIQRAGDDPKKRILVWGIVYWRANCVQVVQRAKGGLNCGALPDYAAIQEVTALKPDYVLMEAINIRNSPAGVTSSLDPGYAWCAAHKAQFKTLVYETPQANCRAFRAWFGDPKNKPPYGGTAEVVAQKNADACHRAVVALCEKYGFPRVDVGPVVDAYLAERPDLTFVPHILNDWYHPNQHGAVCFGLTLHDGIKKHWPELPVRPINVPPGPNELPLSRRAR